MKHMKAFRTATGRKIRVQMNADEIRHERQITAMSIVTPLIMILLFAWAGGIF